MIHKMVSIEGFNLPMKTPQNASFCIKSTKNILGGANPTRPLPLPGLVACTAKKASYAPLKMLTKQVEALDKLTKLTNMIKNEIKDVCIYTD
jgi:hypothetical protein